MADEKKNYRFIIVFAIFIIYLFFAASPVPVETVFTYRWFASLDTGFVEKNPLLVEQPAVPSSIIPFELGGRFGYVDGEGNFIINKEKKAKVYQSHNLFVEYDGRPEKITIYNNKNESIFELEGANGYPFFLDNSIFLLGSEQSSITKLDDSGTPLWKRDFAATITCVDAANGIMVAGLLDGTAEILGRDGERLFLSESSGSRIAAVYGCAISAQGNAIAIVRGVDVQRFMYIEQFGSTWRVTYHEFLEDGLRRLVKISFVDRDKRVIFEREDGIGIYDTEKRQSYKVPLDGRIAAFDKDGGENILFLITAAEKNHLIAIKYPGTVTIDAPFESKNVCLTRSGGTLYMGGGKILSSFQIEKK
ncbi:MAG: WD40 repeat domain-containing protein [Spirochaetaceae bacterium]|jgi:hypothetical protein|nr:WD40 repeat domain-containing protein [Spirochaetaceae bacterium]